MFSKPSTVNTNEFQPPRNIRQRPEWGRQAGRMPLGSRSNARYPNLNMWNMYGSAHGTQPQPASVPSYYYPTMPSAHGQMHSAGYDIHSNGSWAQQAQLQTQGFAYPSVMHDPAETRPNAVSQPEATAQPQAPNIEHPEFVLVRVGMSNIVSFDMPLHQGYCSRCGKNNPKDTPALKSILRAALTPTFMDHVECIFQFISPKQRAYYYELIIYFLSTRKYLSDTKFYLYMYQNSDAEDLLLSLLMKWVWHNEYMADKCGCVDYFLPSLFETAWAPPFPWFEQPMYRLLPSASPWWQNIIPVEYTIYYYYYYIYEITYSFTFPAALLYCE